MGMNDLISYVLVIFKYKGILGYKIFYYIASSLLLQIILQKRKRQSLWKDCSLSERKLSSRYLSMCWQAYVSETSNS